MHVTMATEPASPGRANEDFAAASHNTAVLLDGAGNPPGAEQGCLHGVAWFSRNLGTALLNRATDHPDESLTEALRIAIAQVADLHRDTCDLDHPGSPSTTVTAVRIVGEELQHLVLADSVLILDQSEGEPVVICDEREAEVGARFRHEMDALPSGSPDHAAALRRYMETMRSYRNRPGGFWVASSKPDAAEGALTGTTAVHGLRSVLLLSDGASRLTDRFQLANWTELVQLVNDHGPDAVITRVREIERTDPDGQRWPRGKAHDDATALHCRI